MEFDEFYQSTGRDQHCGLLDHNVDAAADAVIPALCVAVVLGCTEGLALINREHFTRIQFCAGNQQQEHRNRAKQRVEP